VISPKQRTVPHNLQQSQATDPQATGGSKPAVPASERPTTGRPLVSASGLFKHLEIYAQRLNLETEVQVLNLPASEEIDPDSLKFPENIFPLLEQFNPEDGGHTFLRYIGKYLQIRKAKTQKTCTFINTVLILSNLAIFLSQKTCQSTSRLCRNFYTCICVLGL
jgi:hypothetical protein